MSIDFRRGTRRLAWAIFLVPLVLIMLYLLLVLNWSFSDGDRVGYLQKFSHRGWLCKSYEGELAMTTVPGVAPMIWTFSVWDKTVAEQINTLLGKKVVLHYREFRGIPTDCFGSTDYFVDGVQEAKD
ncbi:MAG TPA: hypothetical protein VJV04_09555 [Nitrospiraceae bacterium]|nr:hypothetical protein [Nitrospiraceae bacterium]